MSLDIFIQQFLSISRRGGHLKQSSAKLHIVSRIFRDRTWFLVRTDEHSSHSECAHSFNIQLNSFSIEVMVFGFRDPSFKLKSEGV